MAGRKGTWLGHRHSMNRWWRIGRATVPVIASTHKLRLLEWRRDLIPQSGGMSRSCIVRRWMERTRVTTRCHSCFTCLSRVTHQSPSRNARRKWMRRKVWKEAKIQMREMKKDKLLENIKKLQDYVWLLEKEGADMAEIMEFRSLLESTKKQHAENEAQLAKEGPTASLQVQDKDRLEKTQVETVAAPVVKVERDEQNMDSGKVDGRSLKGCEAVSDENELAEEVNRLKSEIETVSQDRDYQSAQAQSLMADVAKQKEVARIYGVELEDAMRRVAALEEEGLLQRDTIQTLQIQIASANEKLTVPSST